MKREDKVISLELAKKLHELGVRVESEWWWYPLWRYSRCEKKTVVSRYELGCKGKDSIHAYDTAELGEMLPEHIKCPVGNATLYLQKDYAFYAKEFKYLAVVCGEVGKTEAEARGKMLVWLIENDYVKAGVL